MRHLIPVLLALLCGAVHAQPGPPSTPPPSGNPIRGVPVPAAGTWLGHPHSPGDLVGVVIYIYTDDSGGLVVTTYRIMRRRG